MNTGSETDVKVQIMEEEFSCKGLCIEQRNYLDVYPYEQWNAKKIPRYIEGEVSDIVVLCTKGKQTFVVRSGFQRK